jgi:hypothetical protein
LRRSKQLFAFLTLALCALGIGVTSAIAAAPKVTNPQVSGPSYASAHVSGEVDPEGEPTEWFFEVSTDGENWSGTNVSGGFFDDPKPTDPQNVEGELEGLKGGTTYKLRLSALNYNECCDLVSTGAPYPEFTTLAVDPPAFAAADDASEVAYTTAMATGEVERPSGNANSAFDVNCRFEYISDAQFDENIANSAPGFENSASADCAQNPITAEGTKIPVSAELSGLSIGTTYHLRLHAENAGGVLNDEAPDTFTTLNPDAPSVTIDPVTTFGATTAHFSGEITPGGTDPVFATDWEFKCSPLPCPGLTGHLDPGTSPEEVKFDVKGLEPNTTYEVELLATNSGGQGSDGPVSFTTDAVVPGVETVPAFALEGGTEALVAGRINPHNSATTYWIKYGTTEGYGSVAPLTEDASAGSGGTWQVFSQKITGLEPSTVYHFRVFAKSDAGPQVNGVDATFETAPAGPAEEPACPNAALRAENNSTPLSECRAYEQVSPVDKNGFDATLNADLLQSAVIAATDGSSIYFESAGAFADAKSSPLLSHYLSRRGDEGWETLGLDPKQTITKVNAGGTGIQWLTPDLGFAALLGGSQGHLALGDNPSAPNLYLLDTGMQTYQTLNFGATSGGTNHFFVGGTTDGSRQFFQDSEALAPGAITGVNGSGGPLLNLYEWHEGQLKLASVVLSPGGGEEPAPEGTPKEGPTQSSYPNLNLVSADGSRVVFNDIATNRLYLREDGERTLPVSAGAPAQFMGASDDGSKIFFVAGANLTTDASGTGGKLYRFEPETETLTNLFAGVLPGEPQTAGVGTSGGGLNSVVGVSEDGEYVYFRSPTRFHEADNPQGGSAFYLWHNGDVRYIAPDNSSSNSDSDKTPFRVSPDGQLLSFTSTARLTAYDNTDSAPAGDGSPRQDREVYVYDAKTDSVTCVSCNPSGQPPAGAPNGGPPAEGSFPPPPSEQSANPQPGVRNDGSIFFNSRDALVSADVNKKMDVYQWKDGRVHLISSGSGGVDSFLASSSASGDDVFFVTYQSLLPSDKDDSADIYDARVGGGLPQIAESTPCGSIEGCHGAASNPPPFSDPASGSFSSPQKRLDPRAQRLRKALKACRHKKSKRAKAKCRKAAKKRYGKASNGRGH